MSSSCSSRLELQLVGHFRHIRPALATIAAVLFAGLTAAANAQEAAKPAEAPKGDTVRAEVGKPIQAARDLIQAKKFRDALAKVHEAEAVPNLTAYEKFAIDLTRGSAAQGAGDNDTAMSSFESVVASVRPVLDAFSV